MLERRLVAMTTPSSKNRITRALALAAAATLVIVVACETPRPDPLGPLQGNVIGQKTAGMVRYSAPPAADPAARARALMFVTRYFPEMMKGDTSARPAMFVVNQQNEVLATARGASVAKSEYRVQLREGDGAKEAAGTLARLPRVAETRAAQNMVIAQRAPYMKTGPFNDIDPNSIDTVDVYRFKAGELAPNESTVIVIKLKAGMRI